MGIESKVTKDHEVHLGEDKALDFVVYEAGTTSAQIAADPTQNRQNITGYSLEWVLAQLKRQRPILSKTLADDVSITDGAQGELSVLLHHADTLGLAPGTYQHTLWRDDDGSRTVLSWGSFELLDPVEEAV